MKINVINPTIENKIKRVCAYARVSSNGYLQEESLENQEQYYKNKLLKSPEYKFVGVFSDRGITGTRKDRPGFNKMLELCREGMIDKIYTKSISRFSRNTVNLLDITRELKELEVEIFFERENINSLSPDGELWLSIYSSFAEEEARSASENLKLMVKKKYEKGELIINTKRFLGYDKDKNGDLVVNIYESMIVKRIFDEYLSGKGILKIAKIINEENLPTIGGNKWGYSSIRTILKNEKYKGDAVLQKTYRENYLSTRKLNNGEIKSYYIKDNHPAVVSSEDWESVQIIMENKGMRMKKNQKENKNNYPLIGLLYCGICGSTMGRDIHGNSFIWRCNKYRRGGKYVCKGTSILNSIINKFDIKEPTIIKEDFIDGKKHYSYTRKK